MRFLLVFCLCPLLSVAQPNPIYVIRSNLNYTRLEASGDGMFGFEKDGKFGYCDKNGKELIPPVYTFETSAKSIPAFAGGYVILKKDGKYGLMDQSAREVIPFAYDALLDIPSLSKYRIAGKKEAGKFLYGLVNVKNEITVPLVYEELLIDSTLIAVRQAGKWGLVDKAGRVVLPAEYARLVPHAKANMLTAEKAGQFGMIDPSGKWMFVKAKNVYALYPPAEGLVLCLVSGKYGYLDLKGEEVIITKYDIAYNFESTGLARVGKKMLSNSYTYQYGYVDKKGNEIIPLKYEGLGTFSNGLAYAKDPETNRFGYLDKTGKWAIKASFLDAQTFDIFGGAWVKMTDGKFHYIGKTGSDFGAFDDANYRNFKSDGYAVFEHTDFPYHLIEKTGKIVKTIDDCDAIYSFSEGIAGYKCKSSSNYGFIDVKGTIISPCSYDGFSAFAEGTTRVEKKVDGKTKYGLIDTKGQLLLPVEFDELKIMRDGWAVVKKDGNYYFIDKNGNRRDPPRIYDNIIEFRSGYAIGIVNGKNNDPNTFYYIDKQLKEVLSLKAKQAYSFWDDVAVVNRDSVYELMDNKGQLVARLDGVSTLKFSTEDRLAIKENGKWGVIDNKGNDIVMAKYDSCEQFKYGYAKVRLNNKWGVIDRSGKEVLATDYENLIIGENGLFAFFDKSWGVVDKTGRVIIPPTYYTMTAFEKDRALVRMGVRFSIVKSPLAK